MKNNVYPCKPQFYYIKVGFKGGSKLYRYVFVMKIVSRFNDLLCRFYNLMISFKRHYTSFKRLIMSFIQHNSGVPLVDLLCC